MINTIYTDIGKPKPDFKSKITNLINELDYITDNIINVDDSNIHNVHKYKVKYNLIVVYFANNVNHLIEDLNLKFLSSCGEIYEEDDLSYKLVIEIAKKSFATIISHLEVYV